MQGIKPVPHVFVADDAFTLKPFLMKPYPQRGLNIDQRGFNYRLPRARRISENTFGILANRWRVYYSAMQVGPTAAKSRYYSLAEKKDRNVNIWPKIIQNS